MAPRFGWSERRAKADVSGPSSVDPEALAIGAEIEEYRIEDHDQALSVALENLKKDPNAYASIGDRWTQRRAVGMNDIRAGQNYRTVTKMSAFYLEHGRHAGGENVHPPLMIKAGTGVFVTNVDKNFIYFGTGNMQSVKTEGRHLRTGHGFFTTPGEFASAVTQGPDAEGDTRSAWKQCGECDRDIRREDFERHMQECGSRTRGRPLAPKDTSDMTVDQVKSVDPDAEFDRLINLKDEGKITPEQFQEKSKRLFGSETSALIRRAGANIEEAAAKTLVSYKRDRSLGLDHETAMEHALGNQKMVFDMKRHIAGEPEMTDAELAALRQRVEQLILGDTPDDWVIAHIVPAMERTASGLWLAHVAKAKKNPAYEKETAVIRENKKKPAAKKPHDFKAAKWTFPNGHPRCLICGAEEIIGGRCNVTPTAADYAEFEDELDAEFPGRKERREKAAASLSGLFERGEITHTDFIKRVAMTDESERLLGDFYEGKITQSDLDQGLRRLRTLK